MRLKYTLLTTLISISIFSQSEPLDAHKVQRVKAVISAFKSTNSDQISKLIQYPLTRQYPIPNVSNPTEFKKRFAQIVDQSLLTSVGNSEIDQVGDCNRYNGLRLVLYEVYKNR